jgi:dihydrofolate reductase
MSEVRIYVATSADGFIADRDGGVEWLARFDARRYGYDAFWGEIGAVVMGRRTFEHVRTFSYDWPYAGRRAVVLSSAAVTKPADAEITSVRTGIADAIAAARSTGPGDIWIVGGAVTMRSALERGLVDQIEIFYGPVFLGDGIPLLGPLSKPLDLSFASMQTYPDGVVKLAFEPHDRRPR